MAQYDFGTIDPNTKSGTALASDLNSWRNALHSTHAGTTAPTYLTAGMLWADTISANYELKMYDGAQWIQVAVLDATNNVARVAVDSAETSYITSTTAGQIRHVIASADIFTIRSTGVQFNIASPVIADSNNNELISFTTTASAVNQINLANAATGGGPVLSAVGGDTNIDLQIRPKGTGVVYSLVETAATNTVIDVMRVDARSAGTPAAGIGSALLFSVETAAGNNEIGARIEAVTTDVTAASEDFDLVFKTMAAGAAATEAMRIRSTGVVDVDALSIAGTTITTTAAELNFVDGVTSPIQTQVNAKAPLASPTFTGVPAAPTAAAGTSTTQLATTAFVATALGGVGVSSIDVQEFTASGTWTKPANALYSEITVVGGGRAGQVGVAISMCVIGVFGAGGTAGGTALLNKLASALGATEVVTVGAGGATSLASGGTSSFGAHASATGGGTSPGVGSGTGAQAITGNRDGAGGSSISSNTTSAISLAQTLGGSSFAGPGGIGVVGGSALAGTRGGGGGGGYAQANFGAGGAGYVRVVTYCS